MWTKRQGLVVRLKNMKHLRKIRRYGHVIYASKKLKYVVLYVDQDEIDDVCESLQQIPFVAKVEKSYKPFIKTEYENSKPDKAKEYDYKYEF
ncbi:YlbG family protein [Salirhabdus salicampi]|uniref:YlbG family protein n=1 Tax=Salirhabdus salicampi TaxID=476102 RepID=UPI0020C49256|nr:DUF2129 domain-containing protein [Salirhabdus salicampi]MCP8616629.1 DUF2129 domain-containing protein [Salirhabdus salicampi]